MNFLAGDTMHKRLSLIWEKACGFSVKLFFENATNIALNSVVCLCLTNA